MSLRSRLQSDALESVADGRRIDRRTLMVGRCSSVSVLRIASSEPGAVQIVRGGSALFWARGLELAVDSLPNVLHIERRHVFPRFASKMDERWGDVSRPPSRPLPRRGAPR